VTEAIIRPTHEILRAASTIDNAIKRLLQADQTLKPLGRYESDIEALNLRNLIIRHTESVLVLARDDLVLLPSAMVIARASYEAAIKLIWMTLPEDPFDREIRWLAQLRTEEQYYAKIAARLANYESGDTEQRISDQIRDFRVAVTEKLPDGYEPLTRLPNLYQMLESFGEERKYLAYLVACQFTHSTHHATGRYRKNLGNKKQLGEHITARDWYSVLWITCSALLGAGQHFIVRAGGDPSDFVSSQFDEEVKSVLSAINNE
jgi:hypothetical protein